jgi:hypothetical protein
VLATAPPSGCSAFGLLRLRVAPPSALKVLIALRLRKAGQTWARVAGLRARQEQALRKRKAWPRMALTTSKFGSFAA